MTPACRILAACAVLLLAAPARAGDTLLLIETLENAMSPAEREKAALALGKEDTPLVVEALVGALKDMHPNVRAAAARSLGKVGDASAVEPLEGAKRDREELVANAATRALDKLSRRPLKPAAKPEGSSMMGGDGLASKRKTEEVEALQQRLQGPLAKCVGRHAARDKAFAGVTIRFTIQPDGRIDSLALPDLAAPAEKLERCVGKVLGQAKLGAADGGSMTVSWPMMLAR